MIVYKIFVTLLLVLLFLKNQGIFLYMSKILNNHCVLSKEQKKMLLFKSVFYKLLVFAFFTLTQSDVSAQVAFDPNWILGWKIANPEGRLGMAPYDIVLDASHKSKDIQSLPRNFRSPAFFLNPSKKKAFYKKVNDHQIDVTDFLQIRMSGGAQFTKLECEAMLQYLEEKLHVKRDDVYIVDLREEPHGHINNELPVTWYYGPLSFQKEKTPIEIRKDERRRINQVLAFPKVIVSQILRFKDAMPYNKIPTIKAVEQAMDEEELVESLGARYIRIPVTDHFRPEDSSVDAFLTFVDSLPSSAWLHFKCRGGRGRTTTLMAVYHLILYPNIKKEDWLELQRILGGVNLAKTGKRKGGWKRRILGDRLKFMNAFYDYRHAPDGFGKMTWTDWAAKHNRQSQSCIRSVKLD